MLSEITEDHAVHHCAVCSAVNRTRLEDLQAGVRNPNGHDPDIISLPACPCGAMEFLIAAPAELSERAAPDAPPSLHRLLVNHLHAELVERGQVVKIEGSDASGKSKYRVPPQVLRELFPEGLRVEVPNAERM